jgi:hypothetical protein
VVVFKYEINRVTLDKYTVFAKDRSMEIFNWLKHFTIEELSREFEESGLEILEVILT